MKMLKILSFLFFSMLSFNFSMFGQTENWKNAYVDFAVNQNEPRLKLIEYQPLSKKTFLPVYNHKYNKTVENDVKKITKAYLHFLVGVGGGDEDPTFLSSDSRAELSGLSFHLAAGVQINDFLGVGLGFYGISTLNPWNSHLGFAGSGININGYPDIFFYNATFGIVHRYKLIDDKEYRSKTFEKEKGNPLFFEVKGGIRLAKRFAIGMGYFATSKIEGIYKEYEVPWTSNKSIFNEIRKSKIVGFQFFIGFTLI